MPTLKTGNGSIEVSNARIIRQAERMGKLSQPRRAHRLEKAKAALTAGAAGKGKGKGGKSDAIPPSARQAAAIVLGQGISEL